MYAEDLGVFKMVQFIVLSDIFIDIFFIIKRRKKATYLEETCSVLFELIAGKCPHRIISAHCSHPCYLDALSEYQCQVPVNEVCQLYRWSWDSEDKCTINLLERRWPLALAVSLGR